MAGFLNFSANGGKYFHCIQICHRNFLQVDEVFLTLCNFFQRKFQIMLYALRRFLYSNTPETKKAASMIFDLYYFINLGGIAKNYLCNLFRYILIVTNGFYFFYNNNLTVLFIKTIFPKLLHAVLYVIMTIYFLRLHSIQDIKLYPWCMTR